MQPLRKILFFIYFLQIQIIHYDRDSLRSLTDAIEYTNGVAVLATFIEVRSSTVYHHKRIDTANYVQKTTNFKNANVLQELCVALCLFVCLFLIGKSKLETSFSSRPTCQ